MVDCYNLGMCNFYYRNEILFFGFKSMCKLRLITHKLNKAQRLYVEFVSDSPEFTHR